MNMRDWLKTDVVAEIEEQRSNLMDRPEVNAPAQGGGYAWVLLIKGLCEEEDVPFNDRMMRVAAAATMAAEWAEGRED